MTGRDGLSAAVAGAVPRQCRVTAGRHSVSPSLLGVPFGPALRQSRQAALDGTGRVIHSPDRHTHCHFPGSAACLAVPALPVRAALPLHQTAPAVPVQQPRSTAVPVAALPQGGTGTAGGLVRHTQRAAVGTRIVRSRPMAPVLRTALPLRAVLQAWGLSTTGRSSRLSDGAVRHRVGHAGGVTGSRRAAVCSPLSRPRPVTVCDRRVGELGAGGREFGGTATGCYLRVACEVSPRLRRTRPLDDATARQGARS